jgi:hypothetical protein
VKRNECAIACAQAMIQNAMDEAGLTPTKMANRMCVTTPAFRRMMADNLSLGELAAAMEVCGYKPEWKRGKNRIGWVWVRADDREATERRLP